MAKQAITSSCGDSPPPRPPFIDDQVETIRNAVNRAEMREGDTWYLIDSRWFKQWKRYVGWDAWDQSSKGNESAFPGPIDNSNILTESGSLKQHMTETFDFVLLSEIAWKHLVSWFGVVDGQSPVERTVIMQGLYVKSLKVEVYLTEVKLNVYGRDKKDEVKATFSRAEKLRNVIEYARKALDVEADKEVRAWSRYMSSSSEKLDKYEDTLQDYGIYSGQALVLELKNDDGTWPKQTELSSSWYSSSSYGSYSSYQSKVDKGLTGLSNLGNTCFMNSVLQCLSNVPILTEHFLTNEYKGEINRENPLGMRGHLAESYGELMHDMWSERAVVAPRRFKSEVGKFAPRFLGSKQPDSQDLLIFLLNGLHEDLNRVIKKTGDGRPDEEVAAEAWKNHLRQNRSVIVNCIQGQYKSTLVCPDCGKVSVTFDPFMYLTLPLPVKKTKHIPLTLVRQDPMIPPKKYCVSVRKGGVISDISDELEKMTGIPSKLLFITDIYAGKIYKIFHENEGISAIYTDRDNIHAFELPVIDVGDGKTALVVFYHRTGGSYGSSCFGLPMVLGVPRRDTTYRLLYERIVQHIRRFVTVLDDHQKRGEDKAFLFRMTFVNSYGSSNIGEIEEEKPIRFKKTTYVALDWTPEGRRSYDEEAANHTLEDESWSATAVPTLHDSIKCFTEQKRLSEEEGPWYCSKCKKNKQADKTTTLWKLPEVLVVHLQRFSYSHDSRNKLDTYVDFPIENLDMTEFVKGPTEGRQMLYDLCAASNHYSGSGGGHYTAYCKNKTTGDWYHFDDSKVTKVTDVEATVRSKAAYLLIYLRKNLKEEREPADDLSSSQQIADDLLRRLDEVKVENEGQMAKLQDDNQQLRERATQAETDLEKTANLLAESKKQCDDLEAEKARVSEEITRIRAQLTQSARRCTDLEAEKARVSSQLSEEITRIRAQLTESARRCTDLEAEKARVSSQLSEENNRILAQRAEAEKRCSQLEQERDETRLVAEEAQRNVSIYEDVLKVPAIEVEMSDVKLGGGAYGEVRVGYWRGCRVAVKTFYDFLRVDKYLNRLEQEISICRHAHHPNVVSLLGVITEDGIPLSILSELLEGSLGDVIEAADGKLTLREQIDVAVGCSAGVGYLHGLNILHGDIRSSNVVVTSLMEAKICDLGAARFAENSSLSAGPMSPNYIAPERLEVNQRNTKMADVYSLGVTFIELMTGREPAPMKRMTQATSIRHALMKKLSLGMVKQVPRERLLIGECLAQLTAVQKSDEEYRRFPAKRMVKGKVYGGGKVHLVKEPWIG